MLTTIPQRPMKIPTQKYRYERTDMISLVLSLLNSCKGLYRKYTILVPMPNSAMLRKFIIFISIPVRPINSAPRQSRNILREKKARKSDKM